MPLSCSIMRTNGNFSVDICWPCAPLKVQLYFDLWNTRTLRVLIILGFCAGNQCGVSQSCGASLFQVYVTETAHEIIMTWLCCPTLLLLTCIVDLLVSALHVDAVYGYERGLIWLSGLPLSSLIMLSGHMCGFRNRPGSERLFTLSCCLSWASLKINRTVDCSHMQG